MTLNYLLATFPLTILAPQILKSYIGDCLQNEKRVQTLSWKKGKSNANFLESIELSQLF